jgi:hypothetical protein
LEETAKIRRALSTRIKPDVGASRRAAGLKSVVFPEPLGPTGPTTWSSGTSSVHLLSAG